MPELPDVTVGNIGGEPVSLPLQVLLLMTGITLLPALAVLSLPAGLTSVALTHPVPSRRVCMHVVEQSAHLPHISFTADEIIAQAEGFGLV